MRDLFRKKPVCVFLFLLFFAQIPGWGGGCRMVAVPKGPWRATERVIHTEYLAGEEVLGKAFIITRTGEDFYRLDERDGDNEVEDRESSGSSRFQDAGLLYLNAGVRRSCSRKKREKYEIHESREFNVYGCRGAASLLCTILPATIITSIAGVPLIAYGTKRLRDKGGHDSNAVGMIAAGSLAAGAGLAGVVCCPISRLMDRRCKRMKRKVRSKGPETRIVSEAHDDCGTDLLSNGDVLVEPGTGTGTAAGMKLKTDDRGLFVLDLMGIMARNGMETPPRSLVFSTKAGGVRVEPFVMEFSDFAVKRLVRSVRRETLTLQVAGETEFLRPVVDGVRYRILKIECSGELRVTVTTFHQQRGRVWIEMSGGRDVRVDSAEGGATANRAENRMDAERIGKEEKKVVPVEQETSVLFACTAETPARIFLLAEPGGDDVVGFKWKAVELQ